MEMTDEMEDRPAYEAMKRSLNALYLEMDASIADDVWAKVKEAMEELVGCLTQFKG